MKRSWTKYAVSITICIVAMIITVATCIFFVKNVEDVALSERIHYLEQVSAQGSKLVSSKLLNNAAVLNAVAQYIEGTDDDLFSAEALAGVHSAGVRSEFDNVAIVDAAGNATHTIDNIPINIADRAYFGRFMAGEMVISDIIDARDDGMSVIVTGTPVKKDGKVIGGIIARSRVKAIDAILDKNLNDEAVRCYIAHSDGNVFAAAKIGMNEKKMSNILLDLQHADRKNSPIMLRVKSDMENGKKGYAEIMYMNKKFLLNYEPIGVNDLFCVALMPSDTILTNIQHKTDYAIWVGMITLLIVIAALLYSMIVMQKRRSEFEKASGELGVIYESVPGGMFRCDCDSSMRVLFANEYFYDIIGMSEKEFAEGYDKNFSRIVDGGAEDIVDSVSVGGVITAEKHIKKEDSDKWICVSGRAVKNKQTGEMELFCTMTDTTLQHKIHNELHMQEERCALMLEQVKDIIFEWNYDTNEMFYSKYFDQKFGYTPVVNDFPDGFIHLGIVYREDRQIFLNLFKTINMGSSYSEDEMRIRKNDGGYLWCRVCVMAVRDERNVLHRIIGMISDIDSEKREKDEIKETARRDPLTMLYNKGAAEELIEESLSNTNCGQCAFLMIDIDNFKEVNDDLGHKVGDSVLCEIAGRIQGLFRDGDIIARVGGDEFVVFMRNITSHQIADYKANCIVQALDYTATDEEGKTVSITGSVGITFAPEDGSSYTQLYAKADKALYYSKKNGKSQVSVYKDLDN